MPRDDGGGAEGGAKGARMPRRKKGLAVPIPKPVGGVLDREARKVLSEQLVAQGIERKQREAKEMERRAREARRQRAMEQGA